MKKGGGGLKGWMHSGITWQTECHLKLSKLVNFASFDNSTMNDRLNDTDKQVI
jgi:hypothetical protein